MMFFIIAFPISRQFALVHLDFVSCSLISSLSLEVSLSCKSNFAMTIQSNIIAINETNLYTFHSPILFIVARMEKFHTDEITDFQLLIFPVTIANPVGL